jgi:hypothetical protein
LRPFVDEIKRSGEGAGLTLAEVARLVGNGYNKNPTLDALSRYAPAVGRRLIVTIEAIRDTRPV